MKEQREKLFLELQNHIALRQTFVACISGRLLESCLAGFLKGEHDMSASKQTAFDYIDEKSGVITDVSDKIWDYGSFS